ncbi:uncharacterized protein PADG_04589 [Paracoccidioides brasiliensis Pb18]|uniref:Exonuclease domain-containing protein n=1 Tax=Paracoccidioides brasiliensis (strain Pb18) TaxID=502780 RepID=C1GC67_PARBD|nr:uncharacterized protein PADG_04589 [Paracoccidioides brasiliensis Pb18]EEH48510.1 hypothetical protein PADG_04589 [Paracoccidioides brasiliensis Pb18]
MFNHLGLFKDVLCPEGSRCLLLNCIFSHADKEPVPVPVAPLPASTPVPENVAPATAADEGPVRKRRRVDATTDTKPPLPSSTKTETKSENTRDVVVKERQENGNSTYHLYRENAQTLRSVTKAVSPPPVSRRSTSEVSQGKTPISSRSDTVKPTAVKNGTTSHRRQVKKEPLNPRTISKSPASHTVRMAILTKLHNAMVKLNKQVIEKGDPSKKALILSADEVVAMALDEEEKAAKDHYSVYANVIKLRITKLMKMAREEWEDNVTKYIVTKFTPPTSAAEDSPKKLEEDISTGLSTREEISILSKLNASHEVLRKAGYVTTPPTDEEIAEAKRGAEAAQGWELCERCNGRFQVFPGRREDGLLATGGPCMYHHAKPIRPEKQKTDLITGHRESYYPCCKETVGTSAGCTKAEWHVFKVSEVKRLAAILQFKETPRQPNKPTLPPVCFDCEMGYTTLGLELIRLTAISWPQGEKVLDILVKPIGEILDLNSRYSGVLPEHFANATPYNGKKPPSSSQRSFIDNNNNNNNNNNHSGIPPSLPVVDSPHAARALLFQHLQPETPLIGHALENDLKACRIIHPTIVDSALLYPHPRGLPYRFGLRALTSKFLGRHIQTQGGEMGHDSMEDAKATGDLVRVKVREMWGALKRSGYSFESGKLVEPHESGAVLG